MRIQRAETMPRAISLGDRVGEISISRLASAFDMARQTVVKKLTAAEVEPCGMVNGYPVYGLRAAAAALLEVPVTGGGNRDMTDPALLPANERSQWYQSEQRRMDVEVRAGTLIPAAHHEADLADMAKDLVQFLDTLGDTLERDVSLTGEQIEAMNASIARQRQALYDRILAESEEDESQTA